MGMEFFTMSPEQKAEEIKKDEAKAEEMIAGTELEYISKTDQEYFKAGSVDQNLLTLSNVSKSSRHIEFSGPNTFIEGTIGDKQVILSKREWSSKDVFRGKLAGKELSPEEAELLFRELWSVLAFKDREVQNDRKRLGKSRFREAEATAEADVAKRERNQKSESARKKVLNSLSEQLGFQLSD